MSSNIDTTTLEEVLVGKPQYGHTAKGLESGPAQMLRTTDITSAEAGAIAWNGVPYCEATQEEIEKYQLQVGDVLVSRAGTVGVAHLVRSAPPPETVFASYLIRLKVDRSLIEPAFLYWFMHSPSYWAQITTMSSGVAQPNINATKLRELRLPLPSIDEQRAIVETIERLLSRLEAAQADGNRAKRRGPVLRDAILDKAMQGGPLSHPIGDAEEELLKVNETLDRRQDKVDEQARPRWLPERWAWVTLRTAVGSRGLITDGDWVETKDQDPTGNIRLLQLADVGRGEFRDRSNRFINAEAAKRLDVTDVCPGDVLVARLGDPPGDATLVPDTGQRMITAVDVCIIRPEPGAVRTEWLMWCLNSLRFRASVVQHQSGTTRKRIARTKLEQLCVPVPPRDGQKDIVAWIKQEMARVDRLNHVLAMNEERESALRRSILKAAFGGRLTKATNDAQPVKDLEEAIA